MPNVKIGENVIVGAGALVSKDLEANGVYVGIPAKKICSFDDYVNRHREISVGGSFPYVECNQCISNEEIKKAWKFFEEERNFDE